VHRVTKAQENVRLFCWDLEMKFLTGIYGDWLDRENHKQFHSEAGSVLNWWPTTGTVYFQGTADDVEALKRAICSHAMDRRFRANAKRSDS
jgi:hypothetical protein